VTSIEIPDLVRDFLLWIDRARGCSPKTVAAYRLALGQLTAWMQANGLSLRWEDFHVDRIRDFLAYLRDERGNDGRSIALKLAAVKSWLAYLRRTLPPEARAAVPVVDWTYRTPQRTVDALERDQLDRLLVVARQRHENAQATLADAAVATPRLLRRAQAAQRDYVIVLLLAGTGLRVGELVGLDVADVDLADRALHVRGKGGHLRRVWWSISPLQEAFDAYRKAVVPKVTGEPPAAPLFRNERDGGRLTTRSVQRLLRSLAAEAGLAATPHTLRHTFATLAIESGANIKAVSQMLGHRHISTTLQLYTHLSAHYVREVFAACHPFATTRPSLEQAIAWRRRSLAALPDQTGWRQRQAVTAT
jgi:site-specific recombinase XerD